MDQVDMKAAVNRLAARIDACLSLDRLDGWGAWDWPALEAIRAANPQAYDYLVRRAGERRTILLRRAAHG